MIDTKYTEVYPCRCDAEECDYKQQWVDAGKPFKSSISKEESKRSFFISFLIVVPP